MENYPEVSGGELIRAYGWVFLRDSATMYFAQEERRYPLRDVTLLACPLRLEKTQ